MTDHHSDVKQEFAATVDRLRAGRGWAPADLADRSQLDLREIESILRGEVDVQLDAIVLLARAFGVAPGELVEGVDDEDGG